MNNLSIERLAQFIGNPSEQDLTRGEQREMVQELIVARQKIAQLEKQLSVAVCLPACSSSPVCEIEAGYANGVNDSREAIRRAGYLIEGDD